MFFKCNDIRNGDNEKLKSYTTVTTIPSTINVAFNPLSRKAHKYVTSEVHDKALWYIRMRHLSTETLLLYKYLRYDARSMQDVRCRKG